MTPNPQYEYDMPELNTGRLARKNPARGVRNLFSRTLYPVNFNINIYRVGKTEAERETRT